MFVWLWSCAARQVSGYSVAKQDFNPNSPAPLLRIERSIFATIRDKNIVQIFLPTGSDNKRPNSCFSYFIKDCRKASFSPNTFYCLSYAFMFITEHLLYHGFQFFFWVQAHNKHLFLTVNREDINEAVQRSKTGIDELERDSTIELTGHGFTNTSRFAVCWQSVVTPSLVYF